MTTIDIVTAALVVALDDLLLSTQVIDGPRDSVTGTTERILTVGARIYDATEEPDSLDSRSFAEQYTVEMVNSVSLAGAATLSDAVTQVRADWRDAKAFLRDYPGGPDLGLGGSGVLSAVPVRDFELVKRADENGRHAAVRWGVRVYAQVS